MSPIEVLDNEAPASVVCPSRSRPEWILKTGDGDDYLFVSIEKETEVSECLWLELVCCVLGGGCSWGLRRQE